MDNRKRESQTSLIKESQIFKDDIRIEAIGSVDEASAALGFAKASIKDELLKDYINMIQKHLFMLMAALAGQDPLNNPEVTFNEAKVEWIRNLADEVEEDVTLPNAFILPGESVPSAAMAVARTTVRRAERRVVALQNSDYGVDPTIVNYLNRLSYVCYLMELVEIQKISKE